MNQYDRIYNILLYSQELEEGKRWEKVKGGLKAAGLVALGTVAGRSTAHLTPVNPFKKPLTSAQKDAKLMKQSEAIRSQIRAATNTMGQIGAEARGKNK